MNKNPDRNYFDSSDDSEEETEDTQSDSNSTKDEEEILKENNLNKRQTSTSSSIGSVVYSKPMSLSSLCKNGDDSCFTIKLDNKSNMQFKNDFKGGVMKKN